MSLKQSTFRSDDPIRRQNVEHFILSCLSRVSNDCKSPVEAEEDPHDLIRCSELVRSIEDSLECPVCRDRVHGEVSASRDLIEYYPRLDLPVPLRPCDVLHLQVPPAHMSSLQVRFQ